MDHGLLPLVLSYKFILVETGEVFVIYSIIHATFYFFTQSNVMFFGALETLNPGSWLILMFDLLFAVGDLNSQVFFLYFFRFMASTEGLVPITRAYLSTYYDKYPFVSLSEDVTNLSAKIRSIITDLQTYSSLTEGLNIFINFSSSIFYVFELMRITIHWNRFPNSVSSVTLPEVYIYIAYNVIVYNMPSLFFLMRIQKSVYTVWWYGYEIYFPMRRIWNWFLYFLIFWIELINLSMWEEFGSRMLPPPVAFTV